MLEMFEILPRGTSIDFLAKRWFFFILSILLVFAGVVRWASLGDARYGTDFLGGSEFVIELTAELNKEKSLGAEEIRAAFGSKGMSEVTVQAFEAASRQFSLRLPSENEAATRLSVQDALRAAFGENYTIVRSDYVGPTVGKELRIKAILAVALGLLAMLVYVTLRFELAFAVGAVVAIFHDVLVSLGIYLWAGYPITMATIAGALTIVGYSINDTIVVFDRIREDIESGNAQPRTLVSVMNSGINATLSRTILTSLLTLLSCLALYLFGGGAISDLSFFLCVGVVVGGYSTIYIASPVVLAWHRFRGGGEFVQ